MTDHTAEIADLRRKLAARERSGCYGENINAIKARIAWLEDEQETPPDEG